MAALMAPSRRCDGVLPALIAYSVVDEMHRDDGLSGGLWTRGSDLTR